MIAYCGLDCGKCDAFIATKKNDNKLRAKIAEQWSKEYHSDIQADKINCTGCKGEGIKIDYCATLCGIRKCAAGENVENCAFCGTYPCEQLLGFFKMAPQAKANLEVLRK